MGSKYIARERAQRTSLSRIGSQLVTSGLIGLFSDVVTRNTLLVSLTFDNLGI